MRLLVTSDLHLEFGPYAFPAALPDFDAAVFAGDIHVRGKEAVYWLAAKRRSGALKGKPVVFVLGNHELYRQEIKSSVAEAEEAAQQAGIHLLNRRAAVIDGVRFVGAVLWTNYRLLGTPKPSMVHAGHELNDHRVIEYRERPDHVSRFMPWHAAAEHRLDRDFIRDTLAIQHDGPTVVVTHHAPHPDSVQPRHQGSSLSPAFASDLSELINQHQPAPWIHGHDHGAHDYLVGRTRVFANQGGYPGADGSRENADFNPRCVIEVGSGSSAPW